MVVTNKHLVMLFGVPLVCLVAIHASRDNDWTRGSDVASVTCSVQSGGCTFTGGKIVLPPAPGLLKNATSSSLSTSSGHDPRFGSYDEAAFDFGPDVGNLTTRLGLGLGLCLALTIRFIDAHAHVHVYDSNAVTL